MDMLSLPSSSVYAAIIPCYENGNAVKTVKPDGKVETVHKNIKSFMRTLEKNSLIDIASLRRNYFKYINRRNLIPVPLGIDTVMVPFRVRKALSGGDGSCAFVNLTCIKEVKGDRFSVIKLTCGFEINTLETRKTTLKRMKMGHVIKEKYCLDMIGRSSMKEALIDMEDEYNKPATKGDIAILIHELIMLKNKFETKSNEYLN